MFYLIRRDGEMGLFLVLFWCSAVVGRCKRPSVFADNSRFGEFNSRLDRCEFPLRSATGIRSQVLDLTHRFRGQTAVFWAKSTKFPVSTGKTGNFAPTGGVGRAAGRDADHRARPIVPLIANRRSIGAVVGSAGLRRGRAVSYRTLPAALRHHRTRSLPVLSG
jgi:hypothetical protein